MKYVQVIGIYVRCRDDLGHNSSYRQHPKVTPTDFDSDSKYLVDRLVWDDRRRRSIEEPIGIELISERSEDRRSTTSLNGQYVHTQQLLDGLLRFNRAPKDIEEFSTFSANNYQFSQHQTAILNKFKKLYSSHKALWWYTAPCFLNKVINIALRKLDVQPLFFLRSVIRDIYNGLKQNQCQSVVRVYRGQHMPRNEVDLLENSIGELLSTNAFLSTSLNHQVAEMFLGLTDRSTEECRVLFQIDADPSLMPPNHSKPFADIHEHSNFPHEEEVLFMAGSVFRLKKVYRESSGVRVLELNCCSDTDQDVQILLKSIKKNITIDLRTFGDILLDMGKFDLAEQYLLLALSSSEEADLSQGQCYLSLSQIEESRRNNITCVDWLKKAILICGSRHNNDPLRMAKLQNLLGEANRLEGDFNEALKAFKTGLELLTKSDEKHQRTIALIDHNISYLYQTHDQYSEALRYRENGLNILSQILPPFHPELGKYHARLGMIRLRLGQLDQALENLQISFKIREKALPPHHSQIGRTHHDIGLVYEAQNKLHDALQHLNMALKIYGYELQPNHSYITECQQDIQRLMASEQ